MTELKIGFNDNEYVTERRESRDDGKRKAKIAISKRPRTLIAIAFKPNKS